MTKTPFLLLKAPGLLDTLTEALKFLLQNPERSCSFRVGAEMLNGHTVRPSACRTAVWRGFF